MKKFFLYGLVLMMCLVAGCKKENNSGKIYLLQQEVTDNRADGGGLDTTTYSYDAQHRITTIINGEGITRTTYTFTYSSNNSLATAKKLDNNGSLVTEYDFYYASAASGYYFYGPNHSPSDTAVFTYNDNKQITHIQSLRAGGLSFTYDSKGNIETSESINPDGTSSLYQDISYSYDNNKNPFSDIPSGNFFLMYVAYVDKSTLINNVSVIDANTYTYTYNAEGFPTKALVNTGTTIVTLYYNYQVL